MPKRNNSYAARETSSGNQTEARIWRGVAHLERGPCRLDRFLAAMLRDQGVSRNKIKEWIAQGLALVNEKSCVEADRLLRGGERVEVRFGATPSSTLVAENEELLVLHQDRDVLVLNKAAGVTVHPAPGLGSGTLAHRLVHHFPELAELDPERPGIVHRIDKDTSGLLLVARNESARLALVEAFAQRRIQKEYLALVYGAPNPACGTIDAPIGRDPVSKVKMSAVSKGGKPALTEYETLYADPDGLFSLLRVRIHTGRTHQIRVHMQRLGHGLIGDRTYPAPAASIKAAREVAPLLDRIARRQMLHAWRLELTPPLHPEAPPLRFCCPPPKDFLRVFLLLQRRLQRVIVTGMPGCGKSSALRVLIEAGVPCFSADAEVAALYAPNEDGWSYLLRRFGERFLAQEPLPKPAGDQAPVLDKRTPTYRIKANANELRVIDKRALFEAMRVSEALRKELMDVIHPMVRHRLSEFWRSQQGRRLAVAEIPLAVEAEGGAWRRRMSELLVGVFCPQTERFRRLTTQRGWSTSMCATMESWQWPEQDKMRVCDLLLDNTDVPEELPLRVARLLNALRFLRRQRMRRLAALFARLIGAEAKS
jgi:23S rRNA pseudouridine1911/1915/1917 synthase